MRLYIVIFGFSVIAGSLLREFWWGVVVGLILDLVLFLCQKYGSALKAWRRERKTTTPEEKPASSTTPAAKPAEKKSYGKLIGWAIVLALIGWSGYSIENEVGFPGNYVVQKSYEKPIPIRITGEAFKPEGQRICNTRGLQPGKWRFTFPHEVDLEKQFPKEAGFWTRNPGVDGPSEETNQMSFVSQVQINGVVAGKERVLIGDDRCFIVFIETPPGAVMLGNTIFINGKPVAHGAQSVIKPAIVTVKFYG